MKIHARLVATAAVLAAAVSCTTSSQEPPPLAGPSEFALSLQMTVTPDVVSRDGGSQATVRIVARDAYAQPISGLTVRLDLIMNNTQVDCGRLSAKTLSTDGAGVATAAYTAPNDSPCLPSDSGGEGEVRILATPLGDNYDSSFARSVSVRLAQPGIIVPPNTKPTAAFSLSPSSPKAGDVILFDGSASDDPDGRIVRYTWSWGDGETDISTSPVEQHDYSVSGSYLVTLTVRDNDGAESSASEQVSVGVAPMPVAVFTYSPQNPTTTTDVNFNASESTAPEGRTIREYRWNFGDGSAAVVSTSPTTSHKFAAGDYVVTLTVVDSAGKTHSSSQTVGVE